MNERFRQIRNAEKMSQTEFGELLGITKSGVSDIESGRRNVTEQHIIMLQNCKKLKGMINIDWLRTGEGDMYLPLDRETELAKLTVDLFMEESDSFKNRLISMLARMNDEEWLMLEKLVARLSKKE